MKLLSDIIAFGLLGTLVGVGPYSIWDWQWWAMDMSLVLAFVFREYIHYGTN